MKLRTLEHLTIVKLNMTTAIRYTPFWFKSKISLCQSKDSQNSIHRNGHRDHSHCHPHKSFGMVSTATVSQENIFHYRRRISLWRV